MTPSHGQVSRPSFTAKHYEAIAAELRANVVDDAPNDAASERALGFRIAVQALANLFADDNPRFNRDRFIAATFGGES